MKRKIKIVLCTLGILTSMSISTFAMPTTLQEYSIVYNEMSSIQPRTDIKEWLYKIENGNLYKRLYNYSTGRWETDWIFVMSGVEEL